MKTGIVQHHVAIASTHITRNSGSQLALRIAARGRPWTSTKRCQSSVTKDIRLTNDPSSTSNRNEIPSACYVDSPSYPEPSLNRTRASAEVELNTTRPAPLDSPKELERRDYPDGNIPLGDRAKYLFKLGKSFLLFYKTGLKNVWTNSKQARGIQQKFQGQSLARVAKYGGQTIDNKSIPEISRSEYQLCLRTKHDLFKMVPFSLVFLICGEFTPLVIIALGSSVVPYTCRIPRQEQKDLEKRIRQDQQYMEELPRIHAYIDTPPENPDWRIEHLEAYRLGLTSLKTPLPILGPVYHTLFTKPKLMRHCDNLVADTILIQRQGGAFSLSHQDMYEWASSYGLYALRKYIEDCQTKGQEVQTEKLKTALLPKVDAEIKYMLNKVTDWSRLQPREQWRVGLRTVGSSSPDWKARIADIRENWKQT